MANIMVIDRSPFMRGSLKFLAERAGGNTVVCDSGTVAESIGLYENHRPDIVTVDLLLEGACDLMKKMKEINPAVKIIVTAMEGNNLLKSEAESAGACGQIGKPYSYDNVMAVLNSLTRK